MQSEQLEWEERFSRRKIHTLIQQEIEEDLSNTLFIQYYHCAERIKEYREKKYFRSKDLRIQQLPCTDTIVVELMVHLLGDNKALPIQNIAAKLSNRFNFKDIFEGVKTVSEIIAVCRRADLYDLIKPKNSSTGSLLIKSKFTLNSSTVREINLCAYLPPMLIKPKALTSNYESPYLTFDQTVILGQENHHDMQQGLDALNTMAGVRLSLDQEMLQHEELPNKPLDTDEKQAQFRQFRDESRDMYTLMGDRPFYLVKAFDKRGRMYDRGYSIAFQSTGYKKSIINLAHKEVIRG